MAILYLAILGAAGLHLMHYYPLMPEKMATHFDAAGQPNGWMSRDGFAAFYIGLLAFMLGIFYGVTALIGKLPKISNIPNKDYWMAPERQAGTMASIRNATLWLGAAIGITIVGIHHYVILTSFKDKPAVDNGTIYGFIAAFIACLIGYIVWFTIRFRKPDPSV